jgi:hypothetical protein
MSAVRSENWFRSESKRPRSSRSLEDENFEEWFFKPLKVRSASQVSILEIRDAELVAAFFVSYLLAFYELANVAVDERRLLVYHPMRSVGDSFDCKVGYKFIKPLEVPGQ